MDCIIPDGYDTVEFEGEYITASKHGRGEIEFEDGREVFVQYHGLMKQFEPEKPPPRPVMEWGSISGICRAFMRGDRREFSELVYKNMSEPVEFEGGVQEKRFTHSRNKVQEAVLDHLRLGAVVTNQKAVSGRPYKGLILVNPSVSTVKMLCTKQHNVGFGVMFKPSQSELDDRDLADSFEWYRRKMEIVLEEMEWRGEIVPSDFDEVDYLYFCGYGCMHWQDYADSITIELDPNAYVATGRKFHLIESDDDGIRYTNIVYSEKRKRYIEGFYSNKTMLYRYTPDQLEEYFRSVYDVAKWGMHGVLSSFPIHEWAYKTVTDVPVVRGACMLGARAVMSGDVFKARKWVSQMTKETTVSVLQDEEKYPKLKDNIAIYNMTRYYVFDHMRIVLDTGERVFFREDPKGDVSFMGSKYMLSDSSQMDLVIRRDNRGQFKYKTASYVVVWHKTMYCVSGKRTLIMMPQTSVVSYVTGTSMFACDKMFEMIDVGEFEIVKF